MVTLISQHDDIILPAGTWALYQGSSPSVSVGSFTTSSTSHLLGRFNNLTDVLYLKSDSEIYGILPDAYHFNLKHLNGFFNRSQTFYIDSPITYRVWYYSPGTNYMFDAEVVDRDLNQATPTTTNIPFTSVSVDGTSVNNFGYIDITLNPEHYYQINYIGLSDVTTIEFRVRSTNHPISFSYLNNWGMVDQFTQSKSSLNQREVTYDSMITSRLGSLNQISFNPKDDSKTVFTTFVLNTLNQEVFSDFLSSNLIKYGSDVITIDKSSVAQSSKDDFFTFAVNGILNV